MSATLIDGKAISAAVRQEWKERASVLKSKGVLPGKTPKPHGNKRKQAMVLSSLKPSARVLDSSAPESRIKIMLIKLSKSRGKGNLEIDKGSRDTVF